MIPSLETINEDQSLKEEDEDLRESKQGKVMDNDYIGDSQAMNSEPWEEIQTQKQPRDNFSDKSAPISMA